MADYTDADEQDTLEALGLGTKKPSKPVYKGKTKPVDEEAQTLKLLGVSHPTEEPKTEDQAIPPSSKPRIDVYKSDIPGAGALRGYTEQAVQGMPIVSPLLDKATAAAGALITPFTQKDAASSYGQRYSDELARIQGTNSQFADEHPIGSTIANVAGGAAGMAPLAATGVGQAILGSAGPSLGVRALTAGLGQGAIGGTDAALRGDSPLTGAGIGAAAGFGGTIAGDLTQKGVGSALNYFMPAKGQLAGLHPVTVNKLTGALEGESPATITAALDRMGPAGMVGDLNHGTTSLTRALADESGPSKGVVRNAYQTRADQQGARIEDALDRTMGPARNLVEDTNMLTESRKAAADPLYEKFRNTPVPPTKELKALIPRLEAAGGFTEAEKLAAIKGVPLEKGYFNPEVAGSSNPLPDKFKVGTKDDTGMWFLNGDKPIYANAKRSSVDGLFGENVGKEFDKFPSVSGTNKNGDPIKVWYKAGEKDRALREVENFKAKALSPNDPALHYESGKNLGYPEGSVRSYVQQRFGTDPKGTYPTTEAWDMVKRGLDSQIESAYGSGNKTRAAALTGLKGELLDAIGKSPAGQVYKDARNAFAEKSHLIDQLAAGKDTFLGGRSGLSVDELREELKGLSRPEKLARQAGLRAAAQEALGSTVNGDTTLRNKMLAPNNQEKIQLIMGNKVRADDLISTLKREKYLADKTQAVIGGSQTAGNLGNKDMLKAPIVEPWGIDLTKPGTLLPPSWRDQFTYAGMRNASVGANYERAKNELADILTKKNGPSLPDLVSAIKKEAVRQQSRANMLHAHGNALGALLSGAGSSALRRNLPAQ